MISNVMDEEVKLNKTCFSELTYALEAKNFLEVKAVILEDMSFTLESEKNEGELNKIER